MKTGIYAHVYENCKLYGAGYVKRGYKLTAYDRMMTADETPLSYDVSAVIDAAQIAIDADGEYDGGTDFSAWDSADNAFRLICKAVKADRSAVKSAVKSLNRRWRKHGRYICWTPEEQASFRRGVQKRG